MGDLLHWPPSWSMLLLLPALFVGFTVHELAHALVAYLLGDTSQLQRNRLSLNPLRHVSWVGLVVFLLFRFGWAKPVWMDPSRFRMKNQAFGTFLVSIAGSVANLLTGLLVLAGMTITVMIVWVLSGAAPMDVMQFLILPEPGLDAQGVAVALSYYMLTVNLSLAFFNLLPFPPLDGFQAVVSLVAAVRVALRGGEGGVLAFRPAVPRMVTTDAGDGQPPGEGTAPEPGGEELVADDLDERSPAQIHFDIGLAYQKAGQWDEAIARYRQATAHDEQFAMAYYNLGLAYWAKGRIPLAVSAFRAAAQADGDRMVQVQAELRLRELAHLDPELAQDPGPVSPPLEPGAAMETEVADLPDLDRAAVRRVWISLAVGGAAMAVLAISAWIFVTMVALMGAM
jgi:Zn-dependent protease